MFSSSCSYALRGKAERSWNGRGCCFVPNFQKLAKGHNLFLVKKFHTWKKHVTQIFDQSLFNIFSVLIKASLCLLQKSFENTKSVFFPSSLLFFLSDVHVCIWGENASVGKTSHFPKNNLKNSGGRNIYVVN